MRQEPGRISRESLGAVFAELVGEALRETRPVPTPRAVGYLVELLEERLRVPAEGEPEATLAEALLTARQTRGAVRVRRLRGLGDRALFVSGFFGESLNRSLVDVDYYADVGRLAYGDVSATLGGERGEKVWARLFEELADRFGDFAGVLADVGEKSRRAGGPDLLRLFERYLRTGSARDRRRLLRLGHVPPPLSRPRFWQ